MIQSTISRFSTNSFQIKGWSVVLVSALMALSAKEENSSYALLASIPTLVFWGLDGYYLSVERLYRKLFEIVRKKDDSDVDFSMIITNLNEKSHPWLSATFSITLVPFYGSILISIFVIAQLIK
jgi:hypothetical protein